MKIKIAILLSFVALFSSAQTKGVVKDSLTGQPIPYVSIWSEEENAGITSEEDGTFEIATTQKSRNLIFSSLGFRKKKIPVSQSAVVLLSAETIALDEIVLQSRKETQRLTIGQTENTVSEAFTNQPKIDIKFFPYKSEYKKTKFIKKLALVTDSRIADASIKIHFYTLGPDGLPGKEMLDRDFIVTVQQGNKQTVFDLTKFNLIMPKCGLYVGFEKLMIEKNKVEWGNTYYPLVLYNWVKRDFSLVYSGGKWNLQTQTDKMDANGKIMFYEPAINLILTN